MEFLRERDRQTRFNLCRPGSTVAGLGVVQQCPPMFESLHKPWITCLTCKIKYLFPSNANIHVYSSKCIFHHLNYAQQLKTRIGHTYKIAFSLLPAIQAKLQPVKPMPPPPPPPTHTPPPPPPPPPPRALLSMCETETGIRWAALIFHTTRFFI